MKSRITILSLFFIIIGCKYQPDKNNPYWQVSSTKTWGVNEGLLNVESIAYDTAHHVFYATNGMNYEPGTNGFISKISKDGKLLDLKWIAGLSRPTGMAIYDSILYVADVNALVLVNTKKGQIIDRIVEPIANSGLNDVAITEKGDVYVSASFVHAILKLNNRKLEVWSKDSERLKWANGLLAENKRVLVAGLDMSAIDIDSKKISKIEFSPSVQDFDGLSPDGQGGFFLTTVENSGLYYFDGENSIHKLMGNDTYFGDIEFIANSKKLYIPRGKKETAEFFITEVNLN
ncbi:hypothetical protein [Ulvibacterium sp.]|uniref:hypothetical protein n=1 Tax=Ulvibacterium sp. TaxID=2665914 RepID=UPI002602135E|nr:hypothetical protein [Ulvibacterium sp.]